MSSVPASDSHTPARLELSGKFGVRFLLVALLLVFGVVTWIVMSVPADRNELGLMGELELALSEETRVYVGAREFDGGVTLTWNDLLGVSGQAAAAVPGTDIEQLAGEDAKVIWRKDGQPLTHRANLDVNYRFDQLLFQRNSGVLDHVLAISCNFLEGEGQWKSLMIPVRVRSSDKESIDFFPQFENEQAGNFSRGMIPSRHDHAKFNLKLSARQGGWPREIELPAVPLWAPAAE